MIPLFDRMRREIASDDVLEIDLDGYIDEKGIQYIGTACKHANGAWRCLANVDGSLCIVELRVRAKVVTDA